MHGTDLNPSLVRKCMYKCQKDLELLKSNITLNDLCILIPKISHCTIHRSLTKKLEDQFAMQIFGWIYDLFNFYDFFFSSWRSSASFSVMNSMVTWCKVCTTCACFWHMCWLSSVITDFNLFNTVCASKWNN